MTYIQATLRGRGIDCRGCGQSLVKKGGEKVAFAAALAVVAAYRGFGFNSIVFWLLVASALALTIWASKNLATLERG